MGSIIREEGTRVKEKEYATAQPRNAAASVARIGGGMVYFDWNLRKNSIERRAKHEGRRDREDG